MSFRSFFERIVARATSPTPQAVERALDAFIDAPTWPEARSILEQQQDILLTKAARDALRRRITAAKTSPKHEDMPASLLNDHLRLLDYAALHGIAEAWANFERELLQANAKAAEQVHAMLDQAIQELSEQLEHKLAALTATLGTDANDSSQASHPNMHDPSQRSQTSRSESRPVLSESLRSLVGEIFRLNRPQDQPRKIATLKSCIERIEAGEGNEVAWAAMQDQLGSALIGAPGDNQVQNLRAAIEACQAALTVFTRETFPDRWAFAQTHLAIAYHQLYYALRSHGRAENLRAAIRAYQSALAIFTREASPEQWAFIQNNLSNAYDALSTAGDKAENLEAAIQAAEAALTVLTREASPEEWAATQYNLGDACRERVLGNRAENLEASIRAYTSSMEVRTREAFPKQWATIQYNLGNIYRQRILGNRAENLEAAIQAVEAALTVRTREVLPEEWADAQVGLAMCYGDRVLGDRAENLEAAIQAYQAALTVRTREALPEDWALTQNDLSIAYRERILGDQVENLEAAIQAAEAALTVFTREASPDRWAKAQHNLGNAYIELRGGNRAETIEAAIQAYQAALTVRTREALPEDWALTQIVLSSAYCERVLGDRAENLEAAIQAAEAALTVFTREASPLQWAEAQQNLGIAYSQRIQSDRAENLEAAIQAYQAALTVRTREALPVGHRDTQINLAATREAQQRWSDAHAAYTAAREIQRDLNAMAPDAETLAASIAEKANMDLYLRDARTLLNLPVPDLTRVAEILEEGRAQAMRTEMETDILDLDRITKPEERVRAESFIRARDAWRAAQREVSFPVGDGDARISVDKLEERRKRLQEAHSAFDRARDAIREHDNPDFLIDVVRLADIATAITSAGQYHDEALVYLAAAPETGFALIVTFDESGRALPYRIPLPRLTYSAVRNLCQTETTVRIQSGDGQGERERTLGGLVQAQMGWAFSHLRRWGRSPHEALASLPSTSAFAQTLSQLQDAWTADPEHASTLLPLFEAPLDQLAGSQFAEAFNQRLLSIELERSLTELGELGLADLAIHLRRLGIRRIALIAYGLLALFPISAVVIPGATHDAPPARLGDLFEVTLAPSARSYTIARARAVQADRERTARASGNAPGGVRDLILAVGNPLPLPYGMRSPIIYHGSLAFAAAEADGVRRIGEILGYARREIVTYVGKMATRAHLLDSLTRSWYAHLAMHGQFDPLRPRNSRLILAGDTSVPEPDRILTLGECLDGVVNLKGLRLLVLSACETSLIDVRNSVNEVIGIAAGFLQAGAAAVIASLWPVDDRATFLLMTRFTQLWLDRERGWPPARCLAEAQRWMREEATNAVIAAYDPNLRLPRNDISAANSQEPVEAFALAGTRSLRYLRYTQTTALDQLRIEALNSDDPDHLPYANPIYWAAFTVTGA